MDTEKKIIEGALKLYLKYGIKSVTMDDVARQLAMSKKTLYQYVSNKVELVEKTMHVYFDDHIRQVRDIRSHTENPIDELLEIDKNVCCQANERNPALLFEMQKYYPAIYRKLMELNHVEIYDCFKDNLQRGIQMGLYRSDMNIEIITRLYIARVDNLIDTELFPINEFDFREVVEENFKYHLRGIVSREGLEYLEQKLN